MEIESNRLEALISLPPTVMKPSFHHAFGTYDDYGWIEEMDKGAPLDQKENELPNFLVHRAVAEAVERSWNPTPAKYRAGRNESEDGFLSNFVAACFEARIQLFGHVLLGQQHRDSDEIKRMLNITEIILEHQRFMLEDEIKKEEEWANE